MKYDSVLDQQSISGKIVSLILCVWKPCYVKSGHICMCEYVCLVAAGVYSHTVDHHLGFNCIVQWLDHFENPTLLFDHYWNVHSFIVLHQPARA